MTLKAQINETHRKLRQCEKMADYYEAKGDTELAAKMQRQADENQACLASLLRTLNR